MSYILVLKCFKVLLFETGLDVLLKNCSYKLNLYLLKDYFLVIPQGTMMLQADTALPTWIFHSGGQLNRVHQVLE